MDWVDSDNEMDAALPRGEEGTYQTYDGEEYQLQEAMANLVFKYTFQSYCYIILTQSLGVWTTAHRKTVFSEKLTRGRTKKQSSRLLTFVGERAIKAQAHCHPLQVQSLKAMWNLPHYFGLGEQYHWKVRAGGVCFDFESLLCFRYCYANVLF